MGPNNPMASMFEKSSPEDLEKMMNTMSKFSGLITVLLRLYALIKKYKYFLIAFIILIIAYYFLWIKLIIL